MCLISFVLSFLQKLFVDMKSRIEKVAEQESVPKEIKEKHKGFREWNSGVAKNNHQSIVQVYVHFISFQEQVQV